MLITVEPAQEGSRSVLMEAIKKAAEQPERPTIIRLTKGVYHLYADSADRHRYYASNTASEKENPDPTKRIALWLKKTNNITIDGQGSTLMLDGEQTALVIDSCRAVLIKDLTIDMFDPTVPEMTVVETGPGYMITDVHPSSQYEIVNGRLRWKGCNWSFEGGIAQLYDPEQNITWRSFAPQTSAKQVTELSERKLRFDFAQTPDVQIGQTFQMRDGIRDELCGLITHSADVSFSNVICRFMGNFSILSQLSENISYTDCEFAPDSIGGRTNSSFADMLHFSGCKGEINIKNCHFSGAHDDPVNVHGTHLKVIEFPTRQLARVRFMHPQSYGFEAFSKGDEIEIVDTKSLLPVATNRIARVTRENKYDLLLTFEHEIPSSVLLNPNLVIENITLTPEVTISDCTFERVPTRGILISTRKKVVIERNLFFRMKMSAILIADDARSWYESGPVHDVTIRDNRFIECGEPVIWIHPENETPEGPVHKNITITNNTFVLKDRRAIEARSTAGISITNNLFKINSSYGQEVSCSAFEACIDIIEENNRIENYN